MHGMDVLDYREASDSSHITLISFKHTRVHFIPWETVALVFFPLTKLYINFKAIENDT